MSFVIVLLALALLMFVAYRGFSVILFAPICALLAVLFTDPALVAPVFSGVFMDKMVGFIKNYLPVFLLGAVFGKVIELSGFARSIVTAVIGLVGRSNAMLSIVLVCALLTYGGVSLFVVVFAVYPFAAEMFRQGGIPKRLIPATIALGAFTFTMDALPGTPQIQNIIPTTFFKTDTWAAPWLGVIGALFILVTGLAYLEWRRRQAARAGEGYGTKLVNEPEPFAAEKLPNPWLALSPLVIVGVMNKVFTAAHPPLLRRHPFRGAARPREAGGHAGFLGGGDLGGGRRAPARHPHRRGVRLPAAQGALRRGKQGRGRRRTARRHQYRVGVRLRRGHRGAARLPRRRRRAEGHSRSAGQRGGHRDRARRHHRIGLRRHEHRPRHDGRQLHLCGAGRRHSARSPAPHRRHGERRHGHAAAQRRGHHAARGHGPHAQESYRDIFAITLVKTAAVAVAIGVFYLTGIY